MGQDSFRWQFVQLKRWVQSSTALIPIPFQQKQSDECICNSRRRGNSNVAQSKPGQLNPKPQIWQKEMTPVERREGGGRLSGWLSSRLKVGCSAFSGAPGANFDDGSREGTRGEFLSRANTTRIGFLFVIISRLSCALLSVLRSK